MERRPSERLVDSPLVDAVPELVHRPEQRAEVVRAEVRGQPNVAVAWGAHKGVRRLVEPPLVLRVTEAFHHVEAESPLVVFVELPVEERVVDLPRFCDLLDQRHEVLFELVEDLPHLCRLHVRLEVVEEDVVRLVGRVEALDVAVAQLEVLLEMRSQCFEVRFRLRRSPRREGKRRRSAHLPDELRRDTCGLLVVAPCDADETGFEGVVIRALLQAA